MTKARIRTAAYGPYVQSERQKAGIYLEYAKKLVEQGEAYYCFCTQERLDSLKKNVNGEEIMVYDKHCLQPFQGRGGSQLGGRDAVCNPPEQPERGKHHLP